MTGGYRRIKLFSLMVALLVAGLAVVGGTWAWGVNYGDGAGNQLNDEKNYNVEFQYYNGDAEYAEINKNTKVFSGSPWCPGKTEIVYLKLKNQENFPVSCTLTLEVATNDFDHVMSYAVIAGQDLKAENVKHPQNWVEFCEQTENKNSTVVKIGSITLLEQHLLSYPGQDGDTYYLALAIHMDESASSDYMDKSMIVQLKLQVDANYSPGETPTAPPPAPAQ